MGISDIFYLGFYLDNHLDTNGHDIGISDTHFYLDKNGPELDILDTHFNLDNYLDKNGI